MSAALQTWPCGHERTAATTTSASNNAVKCKTCHLARMREVGDGKRASGPWGDAAVVADLKRLHADGVPSSQIVRLLRDKFRLSVSRNAVIGIVHRLGLSRPAPAKPTLRTVVVKNKTVKNPEGSARHLHARAQNTAKLIIAGRGAVHETSAECKPLPPEKPLGEPLVASLMDLQPHHCKWPYGSGDFRFCGRPRAGEGPYCKAHSKVAYGCLPDGSKPTERQLARNLRRHI